MADVLDLVKKLAVEQFDLDESELTPDSTFDDMDADSLDMVEFMMALEEEFGIEIPEEEVENLKSLGDAVTYIESVQ